MKPLYKKDGTIKPRYTIKPIINDCILRGYKLYIGNSFSRYFWL